MIKNNIKLIGSLLIIVFSLVLNACGSGGEGSVLPKKILEIDLGSNDVAVGGQTTYRGKLIIGDNEELVQVVCTSSDETVAKVDTDGIIGLGAGEVTITCTFDVLSVSINLKILSPIQVSVSGLVSAAKNLVLKNNANNDLSIDKNGVSEFAEKMLKGDAYHVTVFEQPADPDQVCTVENASGKVDSAAVTNIVVTCAGVAEETPMNLSVIAATDKLTLHWEAVINAAAYHVYRREDENIPIDSDRVTGDNGVTDLLFTDTNALQAGKTYQYWISAGNKAGFSAMTKFPSTVQLKPAAPRWARVDSCDNTVYLSWQKISGYHYVIKEGSEVLTEGDINEYTTGKLTVGSAHTYHLAVTYLSGIDGEKVVTGAEPVTLTVSDVLCIPLMITVPVIKDGIKTNVLIPIF